LSVALVEFKVCLDAFSSPMFDFPAIRLQAPIWLLLNFVSLDATDEVMGEIYALILEVISY